MAKPNFPPGTRVALYLRRSTAEHQEESLETQRQNAVAYAKQRGWVIVAEYIDDAISRAEFKKRSGLISALNAAEDKQFDILLMRDETRFGGDQFRTGLLMQDLADHGCSIVYYYSDELVDVSSAVSKFLIAARNFASELEREKISERVHENHLKKAKAGKPVGGVSYGYAIANKQYVVVEDQAAIVRRIFEMYADGSGQRSIARQLNDEGIRSPRAGKRGTGSWAPSAIRAILLNPRYVGKARWNQTRKLYRGGTKVREDRPVQDYVDYDVAVIIEQPLWDKVQARFKSNEGWGKPKAKAGAVSKYLMTGLSRCAECGGPMVVYRRKSGTKNVPIYICGYRHQRGKSVCSNATVQPVVEVDAAIIEAVKAYLTPEITAEVVQELRTYLQDRMRRAPDETENLSSEASKLKQEISRLAQALAQSSVELSSVITLLAEKEARLRQVETQLAVLTTSLGTIDLELRRMEKQALERVANLYEQIDKSPEDAKRTLTALMGKERMKFSPGQEGFRIEGPIALLDQDCVASPAGFEPASPT